MKWIGAHIWDWITRFRNDVYFENTAADASTSALVVDSDGKVGVNSSLGGSSDVVDDTTPQLGGDLDVNGNDVVSASDGDITIDPDGTGSITLRSDSIVFEGASQFTLPSLKLTGATLLGSNYLGFTVPLTVTASQLWTLPDGDGSVGQVMKTSGAGILSWGTYLAASNPAMLGIVTIKPSGGQDARLAFYENGNTYFTAIQAHDDLAASYSLYLPTTDGSADQVLKTDGVGNLGWVNQTVDTDTNTYLGSTDQELTGNRTVTLDGNNLTFRSDANLNAEVLVIDTQGGIEVGGGEGSEGAYFNLREAAGNGANYVGFKAPDSITSSQQYILPDADGTSGQALITDGGGNLSFSTVGGGGGGAFDSLLMTMGGRVQHTTSYDNRMIICGGVYGPSYYIWSSAAGITASSGGTVDTTVFALPSSYQHYGSIRVPTTAQVKVDFLAKPLNSSSYSKSYVMQLWEFTPTIGTTSGPYCTLRAKVNMTSSSSMSYAQATMTSTSDITAGKYIFVTIGMDAQTLTTTAYQYTNINITLLA